MNTTTTTTTLHLRSAFQPVDLDPDKPKFPLLDRHFRASRAELTTITRKIEAR